MQISIKNKALLLIIISFLFNFNSCKKDSEEPHVFKRGQIIEVIDVGSRSSGSIRSAFNSYDVNLASLINYQYDVDLYVLIYETITPDGQETEASGLLAVPKDITTSVPLLSFQHGTVLKQNMVPSSVAVGSGMELGLIFGTEGYVVSMPDFLGLGKGSGLHPYMHAKSEATATIDMIRAAKNYLLDLGVDFNEKLFLMGYSQGGHTTMATHKAIEEEYDSEFSIIASSPMAGPYDVSGVMTDIVLAKEEYIKPGYLPYVLYSYNSVYNIYPNLLSIFKVTYNSSIPPFFNGDNSYTLSDVDAVMPAIPSDILTESTYNEILNKTNVNFWNAMRDNDLYDWSSTAPIRMFHCDGDVTVPMSNSEKALQSFSSKGITNVSLVNPLSGGTHSSCLIPSIIAAKNWFNTF